MQTILLQQLREYLTSLRLQLGLLVVVAFFGINGLTSAWRMQQVAVQEQAARAEVEERLQAASLQEAATTWIRVRSEPTGTEFIAEGGFKWMWGQLDFVSNGAHPSWFFLARDVNFWMSRFEDIDWLLIVRVVLSFLCVVLAYDGISGEAERGTLRQILANPLSRARLLAAKYLAALLVLMTVTCVGIVLSLLMLSLSGVLQFTGALFVAIGFFLLGTAVYLSLFLFLSLGVSSLTRSSVSSLVLLTLAWAAAVVIVPQTSYLVAMQSAAVDSGWLNAPWTLRRERIEELRQRGLVVRDSSLAASDGFAQEQRLARELEALAGQLDRMTEAGLATQLRRYRVARTVNLLSPGYAFQYATEALLGAGIVKRQNFYRQAQEYRRQVQQFLRERDRADPRTPHLPQVAEFLSQEPFEGPGLPRFVERPPDLRARIEWGGVPLLVLVLEGVAACLFAVWAVNRADVTGYAMAES